MAYSSRDKRKIAYSNFAKGIQSRLAATKTAKHLVEELLECTDFNEWELNFIDSVEKELRNKDYIVTYKQLEKLQQIAKEHLA